MTSSHPYRGALFWDDLRMILAIGENGTLSRAALALRISHPTLSRRLREAEERLGCRLVERTPQIWRLTPAGEEIRALAARMAIDIVELERRIVGRDQGPGGPVRLTAPDAVAEYVLPGILANLGREFPEVSLELVVSNQVLSLAKRQADLAIRVTEKPDPGLKGRRVATVGMAVYRSQSLANMDCQPTEAPWIGFEAGLACSGPGRWLEKTIPVSQIRFRANTLLGAAKAVAQGTGFGLLPCFIGGALPNVVRASDPVPELETGLWLLVHPDVARLPRIKRTRAGLARELVALAPVISGRQMGRSCDDK